MNKSTGYLIARFNTFAFILILGILFVSYTSNQGKDSHPSEPDEQDSRTLPQVIRPVDLEKDFSFAGEKVPTGSFDVRERLDRELLVNSYWHSSTVLHLKSAARYFPLIESILSREGIPDDFKYLAIVESSLRNARSPSGASGVWQFMKKTGQAYGLEINNEVDERYHLVKATEAACRYLRDYKERFGSWTLAAAAYNMGGTRLSRELRLQKQTTYYDLNLNEETMRYLFRIVAVKEIMQAPLEFGFQIDSTSLYDPLPDCASVEIDSAITDLAGFAADHGVSYRILKVYNPWLRSHSLSNKYGKTYQIEIPVSPGGE